MSQTWDIKMVDPDRDIKAITFMSECAVWMLIINHN